jgi:hypothetical protein
MQDYTALSTELKRIWSNLSPAERARLEPMIRTSHADLLRIRERGIVQAQPIRELALTYSLLHDDPDGLLSDASIPEAVGTSVGPDGQVYFGNVDYDSTDPGWVYVLLAWDWTEGPTPTFSHESATIEIPSAVTINLLGDWGGNNTAAQEIASNIDASDFSVHLGDVYYAGTNANGYVERDYEQENFLAPWPGRSEQSFALNSNHDMYAHGTGYFNTTLASPTFQSQNGCSYFALYNGSFRIVGLDTAYFDQDASATGYMIGTLGPTGPGTQAQFLNDQAQAAAAAKQTLILLTHHDGLLYDGSVATPLWDEVLTQLTPLSGDRVIWYWGHEHMGVVYTDRTANGITVSPRCCGHSCIPWGIATGLNTSGVTWYEQTVLGPGTNYFVANGYATLAIDESSILETFYRQDGSQSWRK